MKNNNLLCVFISPRAKKKTFKRNKQRNRGCLFIGKLHAELWLLAMTVRGILKI